jgi:uncharacterized protein YndB with AHSA1/START domain
VTPFHFDRSWQFDVPVERLWDALSDTTRFPEWFPWLEADHLGPLVPGTVARFRVDPPLPYRLNLTVSVLEVEDGRSVDAQVSGDLAGPARLEVEADGDSSSARLTWSLVVQRPALNVLERIARPVMVWGHDAVVARGLQRFSDAIGATTRPP